MAIYWYNPNVNKRADWDTMNVSELTVTTVDQLDTDSVILIHMGDIKLHWDWLGNANPELPEVLNHLGYKIKSHQYGELVFFTGGVYDLVDAGLTNSVEKIIPAIFPGLTVCYYKCPNQVPVYAAGVFGDFVAEYYKSGGKLRARDWFDPQLGELKTAFRLLVQFWLVEEGHFTLSGVPAKKNQKSSKDPNFWTPVKSGDDSYSKLRQALKLEECPKGWNPHLPPQNEDASKWLKWAVPFEQSAVNSK